MFESVAQPWMWGAFIAFVLAMLALDIFALGGSKSHKVSVKEAAIWSIVWVSLALLFNVGMYFYLKDIVGETLAMYAIQQNATLVLFRYCEVAENH